MALEAQNNPFTSILMVEAADVEALPDADPASGQRRLAVGLDHLLYLVDDSGVKHGIGGLTDPMTTRGDIIVRDASNATARLGRGSAGQFLKSDGTDLLWATPTMPPLIGCFVYNSGTQSFNATTLTTILFDSELYDTSAFHSTSSNTGRLVAPVTGYYRVATNLWYATTSGINYVLLEKNTSGAYIRGGAFNFDGAASGAYGSTTVLLTAGDYLTVVGYHTQAGSLATGDSGTTPSQQNWATMELIGV